MKHILIVGGGVAGYSAAIASLDMNVHVTVLDSGENHSSLVAVGQINPMVFRRMNKSWRLDEFMPVARNFYERLDQLSDQPVLVDTPIRRLFSHEQEREEWLKKQDLPEYSDYLETLTEDDMNFDDAINICGSGRVKQSYYVQAINFLAVCKQFVEEHPNGIYRREHLDYAAIDPVNSSYQNTQYDGILFCEGYKNSSNPFFNFLTVNCTKGQLITVRSAMYDKESLNRKCFVLPIGSELHRVGSTYEWNDSSLNTTSEAANLLSDHLRQLIHEDFEVVDQIAGIRPTTFDRRPFMGKHTDFPRLFVYNGLGTKGYMMAPLLGKEMALYILEDIPLHPEVRLERVK